MTSKFFPITKISSTEIGSKYELLGIFIALCASNGTYLNWTINGIARFFMPSIGLGQCNLYVSNNDVVGFVTWAKMDPARGAEIRNSHDDLRDTDWNSGQELWIVDLVSPCGFTLQIARDLQTQFSYMTDKAWALRRRPDGSVRKIARFPRFHQLANK